MNPISSQPCANCPKLKHHCGVFGIMHHPESLYLTYLGIFSLQHRGQEGAGIFGYPQPMILPPYFRAGQGLVCDVFSKKKPKEFPLHYGMGHVRYSTSGEKTPAEHNQPIVRKNSDGQYFALSHNGTIPPFQPAARGDGDNDKSDSAALLEHIMKSYEAARPLASFARALASVEGAYSVILMTPEGMLFARDPWGVRPLVFGEIDGAPVLCSETCALDMIGGRFIREIEAGECGFISYKSPEISFDRIPVAHKPARAQQCIFELVYFARPDSIVFGHSVYEARKIMGRLVAANCAAKADLVVPVPDSGILASQGFAEASGLPWELGIIRNHYIHRTFIEPPCGFRDLGVIIKHNPVRKLIAGKKLLVVDDSIVRATTSKKIIQVLRNYGAKEVHIAVSSPPFVSPCFYGVDTPSTAELIAANYDVDAIRGLIGADSLSYLDIGSMKKEFGRDFCYACFDRDYQVARDTIKNVFLKNS